MADQTYGISEVVIDGQPHRLIDFRGRCIGSGRPAARWAISLAEFQRSEAQLWEPLAAVLRLDADVFRLVMDGIMIAAGLSMLWNAAYST